MNQLSFYELRQLSGMSVEELAPELGYSPSTVYRWERGETAPKAAVYRALETLIQFSRPEPPKMPANDELGFRFIDLFAGIGGLRIPASSQNGLRW